EPRINREAPNYPAIASLIAKMRGANHPAMPPYVAFMRSRTHLAFGGYLGKAYDPFIASRAAKLPVYSEVGVDTGRVSGGDAFQLPAEISQERLSSRRELVEQFDQLNRSIDGSRAMDSFGRYEQLAVEMLVGGRIREALDLSRESAAVRDRYGKHLWCQQALMARRLVEA